MTNTTIDTWNYDLTIDGQHTKLYDLTDEQAQRMYADMEAHRLSAGDPEPEPEPLTGVVQPPKAGHLG